MTSKDWCRAAALATLVASVLTVAGCSKSSDSADYGGADPGAVTRATDSADAGTGGPSATARGAATDTSSSIVSTAHTSPSEGGGVGPSPALSDDAAAGTPAPSASSASPDSGATTGRATGPRS